LLSDIESTPVDRIKGELETKAGSCAVLGLGVAGKDKQSVYVIHLDCLITKLKDSFPYIVLDLGGGPSTLEGAAQEVSDFVIRLTEECEPGEPERTGSHPRIFNVVNLHNSRATAIPINHCEPFVIPDDPALGSMVLEEQVTFICGHPRSPVSPPLHRLARKILGRCVGVAVGGGAAFGIAHVGVFKVLEENGIPVDLVAGTSMGSIVAVGYAAGVSPSQMVAIANRVGTKLKTLSALDFTLTKPGVLAGDRLIEIFSPWLRQVKRFEQLRYPCRTVAADIESGERVWIGQGRLDQAFRASCSVPLLWAHVRWRGRVLVDGGILDPVPAEVVREMGADVCIAVNVVPPLKKGVDNVLTRAWRRLSYLNPLSYLGNSRGLPNTFDIVMNSIQALEHELGNFKAISADARIVPDLSDFTWIEFYRPRELIERGAAAAERALPEIRRILDECRPRIEPG
jgi:NTE family protein